MLPSDVIACDTTCAAFDASVVSDCDLILLPLENVSGAHSDTSQVERALKTHSWIFDPQMRVFVDLVSIAVEFVLYSHDSLSHEMILHR